MFSLEETLTWTAEDVFKRLQAVLPPGWVFHREEEDRWHRARLEDADGVQQWAGEHPDPKILGLDALGFLRLRHHRVKNPVWKPRSGEVPLHRPYEFIVASIPDPPDLDPEEVAAVYKAPR